MFIDKEQYPVSRIGNTKKPRLLILLENSASDPDYIQFSAEHLMKKENAFMSDTKGTLDFKEVLKYDIWWYKFWEECKMSFKDIEEDDILALEFYPYFTRQDEKYNEIYSNKHSNWNDFAKNALKRNIELLNLAIDNDVPVFVYYKSGWYNDCNHFEYKTNLKKLDKDVENTNGKYISDYIPKGHYQSQIRGRLGKFLSNFDIQDRIKKLRQL